MAHVAHPDPSEPVRIVHCDIPCRNCGQVMRMDYTEHSGGAPWHTVPCAWCGLQMGHATSKTEDIMHPRRLAPERRFNRLLVDHGLPHLEADDD